MNVLEQILTAGWITRLGWTLLHSLWSITLVTCSLALLLSLLYRASANIRYLTACAGLVFVAIAPIVTFIALPYLQGPDVATTPIGQEPPPTEQVVVPIDNSPAIAQEQDNTEPPSSTNTFAQTPSTLPNTITVNPADSNPNSDIPATAETQETFLQTITAAMSPWMPWLVIIWLAGVFVLSIWNFGGWVAVQRMKRLGTSPIAGELSSRLSDLAQRLGINRTVYVMKSLIVEVPAVVGWLRPTILLPASILTGLSPTELDAIIAHELAHIRRHDYLVNLIQTIIETLLFYHPGVWWLSRRIRVEREHCCDDLAVSTCGNEMDYAAALAAIEVSRSAPKIAMTARKTESNTLSRIRRILGFSISAPRRWGPSLVGGLVASAMIIAMVTCCIYADKPSEELLNGMDITSISEKSLDQFELREPILELDFMDQAWNRLNNWDNCIESVKDPLSDDPGYPTSQRARTPEEWKTLERADHFKARLHFAVWLADEFMPACRRYGMTLRQRLGEQEFENRTTAEKFELHLLVTNYVSLHGRVIDLTHKHLAGPSRYIELTAYSLENLLEPLFESLDRGQELFRAVGDAETATSSNEASRTLRNQLVKRLRNRNEIRLANRKETLSQYVGRVVDISGQPIAGAVLTFTESGPENTLLSRVVSDAKGHFLFPAVMPLQNFVVAIEAKGFQLQRIANLLRRDDGNFSPSEIELFRVAILSETANANPLELDDYTLITIFRTGNFLRRVAFDCEAFYDDRDRLPRDVPDLASRYQEQSRDNIGNDPFAPGKKLRLVLDKDDPRRVQVWSVGPDGDWDGGKQIDSTKQPLDGDLGAEIHVGNTDWHLLADETLRVCLKGERLAHYLAAKGPKLQRPELKDDGLKWGPVVDGLQMAVELSPKKDVYLLGETIDVKFHVRNAADYEIQIGLAMPWRQDLHDQTVSILDENGKSLKGKGVWMSGLVSEKQSTLKPGETASYESCDLAFVDPGKLPGGGSVGYWVEAGPGVYTARFKQHFPIGFHSEPRQWRGILETGTVSIRIAEHPKFAIHRVTAYRKPGDRPGTFSTLTFRESGNPARFDPMRPDLYPLKDLVIEGTPLLTDADIVAYNWRDHSIKLKPDVGARLFKAVKLGNMYVPFVIQVEGEPVYLGAFRPPYSSNLADMPHISLFELNPSLLPESEELVRDSITIEGRQIAEEGKVPDDPRPDERVRKALQVAGKLIDLRSTEEMEEPTALIESKVLRAEMSKLCDRMIASQKQAGQSMPEAAKLEKLKEAMLQRCIKTIPGLLMVSREQEAHYAGGKFDDQASKERMQRTIKVLEDFDAELPVMCVFVINEFDAGRLSGGQLEIANRIMLLPIQAMIQALQDDEARPDAENLRDLLQKVLELTESKKTIGLQARLQSNGFRGGYQWMGFELKNDSSDLSVQLGPNGRPTELFIDDVAYVWGTGVAGSMPVCKPGGKNSCEFKLDENWMAMKTVSGPEMLKLKPGKHTIKAIVYASAANQDPFAVQLKPVASNPVEIEVPPVQASTENEPAWGEPVNGIASAVRPVKPTFTPDEDIAVDVIYKNVSDKPVTVSVCPDPLYTWLHLWVKTAEGQNVLGGPHANGTRPPLKLEDFVTLDPKQTASFRQVITRSQHPAYWPNPGTYFLHAEINKINRIDKHLPGYDDFCKKHGLTPWVAGIESGKTPIVITAKDSPQTQSAIQQASIPWSKTVNGLQWHCSLVSDKIEHGEPVIINLYFKNVSDKRLSIFKNATVSDSLYPMLSTSDGNRDAFSIDHNPEKRVDPNQIIMLSPGKTYHTQWKWDSTHIYPLGPARLTTSYFSPENTNPAIENFWYGQFRHCPEMTFTFVEPSDATIARRVAKSKETLEKIWEAFQAYRKEHGKYPTKMQFYEDEANTHLGGCPLNGRGWGFAVRISIGKPLVHADWHYKGQAARIELYPGGKIKVTPDLELDLDQQTAAAVSAEGETEETEPSNDSSGGENSIEAEPTWGSAVDGIQLRLQLEPASCKTIQNVSANLEIRNTGTRKMNTACAPENFVFDVDGNTYHLPITLNLTRIGSLDPGEKVQHKISINQLISDATDGKAYFFQGRHAVKVQLSVSPKDGEPGVPVKITSNTAQLDVRKTEATVTGTVIGTDGKPAVGYRVTALPKAWSMMSGMMPTTITDENGAFSFQKLPEGPCDVAVTSTPLTNQPNIRIEDIVLREEEPTNVELSLEQMFHFGGHVTDSQGQPQSNRMILAIWKDPAGERRYSSNTKTDDEGRYQFDVPFAEAERILICDTGGGPELESIKSGRDDIVFTIESTSDKSPAIAELEQRTAMLRKDADTFSFSLHYRGKDNEPYLSLLLEGPATTPRGPLAVGWTGARMSREQVLKLIEHLKAEGFLKNAQDIARRDMAFPKGPTYTLIVRGPEELELYEDLGWDLKMIQRFDAIATILEDDASREMKKVISLLESKREEWDAAINREDDGWGPAGTDGLQIRLMIPETTNQTPAMLTGPTYFDASPKAMTPQIRLEVKNSGEKTITLIEQNVNVGRKNIQDEWLVGLSLDLRGIDDDTPTRLNRTDDQDRFWSAVGGAPWGRKIKPGETVSFGLRLNKLADTQGHLISSMTGLVSLRPILSIGGDESDHWHGTAEGSWVSVVIQGESDASDVIRHEDGDVAWGEAVDGVQCHLEVARTNSYSNETLQLIVSPRTQSEKDLLLSNGLLYGCELEVNGKWYEYWFTQEFIGQAYLSAHTLEQKKHSLTFQLKPQQWRLIEGKQQLQLEPGKHQIRFAWAAYRPDYKTNPPDERPPIKLASNPVEIEILPEKDSSDRNTAWGKSTSGLQLGLALDLQKSTFMAGETVHFNLLVRNTNKKPMKLVDFTPLAGWQPTVRDSDGKSLPVSGVWNGPVQKREQVISAGETVSLGTISLRLDQSPHERSTNSPHLYLEPGKYSISQTYRFADYPEADFSGELASGEITEFVVVAKPEQAADHPAIGEENADTAKIELSLDGDEVKTISVALGQNAVDIYNLCQPAKVYADDDPWLAVAAAGGGSYVFFFATEDTSESLQDRIDPRSGNLYAVLHYPTDSKNDGRFLLPGAMDEKTYGDFVTLKVPLGFDKAKAATVVLGISTEEVKQLFSSAEDHAGEDHAIVFDSIYNDDKYLLLFNPKGEGTNSDAKLDKLSEVIYLQGERQEAIYLLPRNKRGQPVAAEHRELLGLDGSKSGTVTPKSTENLED